MQYPTASSPLTQNELKDFLDYNPETGEFTWRKRPPVTRGARMFNTKYAGRPAGRVSGSGGYREINIVGYGKFSAHRLAFLYMTGAIPAQHIDHKNRDRLDNRWANLRVATQSENLINAATRVDTSSGVRGVRYSRASTRRPWQAYITVRGRSLGLGGWATLEEATIIRKAAELTHYGRLCPTK
jgi:hypothetical protein